MNSHLPDLQHPLSTVQSMLLSPRSFRKRGSTLQTALWTLSAPSGRTVTLIGMMHVGDEEYYQEVSSLLASLSPAEVQYEMVRPTPPEEVALLSPAEQDDLQEARSLFASSATPFLADALGLSLQKQRLAYPEDARNVDIQDADLVRRLGMRSIRRLFDTSRLNDVSPEALRKTVRLVLGHYYLASTLAHLLPAHRHTSQVILHERNAIAMVEAEARLAEGDLVLVWGAAHLPGMRSHLEGLGFTLTSEAWLSVCAL